MTMKHMGTQPISKSASARSRQKTKASHFVCQHCVELKTQLRELREKFADNGEIDVQWLAKIQEIAHIGSWKLDLVKNHLAWSDEVYRIFGLKPQEFGATYEAFLDVVHPDDRRAVIQAYEGSIRDGKDGYEIEHRIVQKGSGEIRVLHERCEHIRNDTGKIICSIGMVHDITERKKLEAELDQAYGKLELKVAQRTHELVETNEQLKESASRIQVNNDILRLLGKAVTRKEYLDGVVDRIKTWSDCECVGVRMLLDEGDIPYESLSGFSKEHWEAENWLSIRRDQCACIRVMQGKPDPSDMRFMTRGGSFCCGDSLKFWNELPEAARARFRGCCVREGYTSIAVVPIRFAGKITGSVHLADKRRMAVFFKSIEFVESLASLVGEGIHRLDMEEKIKQDHDVRNIINVLLNLSLKEATIEGVLPHALGMLLDIPWLGTGGAGRIFLVEDESDTLVLKCHKGIPGDTITHCVRVPFGKCACGMSVMENKIWLVPHGGEHSGEGYENINSYCGLCVPILHGGRTIGIINLSLNDSFRLSHRKRGQLIAIANTMGSIIMHMQMEHRLNSAKSELIEAKRLSDIGSLAATVAHELRNPLGVMKAAVYNLRRKSQNPALEKHIVNIEGKITESSKIIDNLLFYSRIKKPSYEKVDIIGILNECIATALDRFKDQKINVKKRYKEIEGLMIDADPFQMKEIFNNIMSNAFQSFECECEGGVVEIGGKQGDRGFIEVSIKDNGSGIAPEDIDRVFEPFFTRKTKGTGLGLSICRELVHLHKGDIQVASEKGKGTAVVVKLAIEA